MIATIYTSALLMRSSQLIFTSFNHMLTILIRCSYKILPLSVNTEHKYTNVHSQTYWTIINSYEKERTFFPSECQFCLRVKECGHAIKDVFL